MRSILIFIFIFMSWNSVAQKQVMNDTSKVEKRLFNKAQLERIKNEDDFQYNRYNEPPKSLWDRFWSWVWFKINQLLSTRGGRTTLWTVFIIFGVAMITYFVLKVMGMNKGGLFGRSSSQGLDYTITSDDIHGISFDEAIQEAIAVSNYRLAVRLLYLQSLKKLSDNGFINWQLNKTNTDYLQETSGKNWHSLFAALTSHFEYTWYGEATVNQEHYTRVQQQFSQFNNQLKV